MTQATAPSTGRICDHNDECVGCGAHIADPCAPGCAFHTGVFDPGVLLRLTATLLEPAAETSPAGYRVYEAICRARRMVTGMTAHWLVTDTVLVLADHIVGGSPLTPLAGARVPGINPYVHVDRFGRASTDRQRVIAELYAAAAAYADLAPDAYDRAHGGRTTEEHWQVAPAPGWTACNADGISVRQQDQDRPLVVTWACGTETLTIRELCGSMLMREEDGDVAVPDAVHLRNGAGDLLRVICRTEVRDGVRHVSVMEATPAGDVVYAQGRYPVPCNSNEPCTAAAAAPVAPAASTRQWTLEWEVTEQHKATLTDAELAALTGIAPDDLDDALDSGDLHNNLLDALASLDGKPGADSWEDTTREISEISPAG